jgi:hypothetical protein
LNKHIVTGVAVALAGTATATDYSVGQCPVAPNCGFARPTGVSAPTYSDTFTFYLGDWQEYYGTYVYTSSVDVVVAGVQNGKTPCSGRGCQPRPYSITIDSATLDGVPMTQLDAYHWKTDISLSPGAHVIAVAGTATGATWYAREAWAVQGIQYTLVPPPPCTDCGE